MQFIYVLFNNRLLIVLFEKTEIFNILCLIHNLIINIKYKIQIYIKLSINHNIDYLNKNEIYNPNIKKRINLINYSKTKINFEQKEFLQPNLIINLKSYIR